MIISLYSVFYIAPNNLYNLLITEESIVINLSQCVCVFGIRLSQGTRDLLLALESTGDFGCFDVCVKNMIIFWIGLYSQN